MEKENYEQLSPKKVKKFEEEHMTEEQKEITNERVLGFDLAKNREKIKELMSLPLAKEEHALILEARLFNIMQSLNHPPSASNKLNKLQEKGFKSGNMQYGVDVDGDSYNGWSAINDLIHQGDKSESFHSAFMHEFLGASKDYILQLGLNKEDKLAIVDILKNDFDKIFGAKGTSFRGEDEYRAHKDELVPYFNQLREELDQELESREVRF